MPALESSGSPYVIMNRPSKVWHPIIAGGEESQQHVAVKVSERFSGPDRPARLKCLDAEVARATAALLEEMASSELGAAERLKAVERGYEKALEAAQREHEAQLAAERTQLQADAARAVEEALAAHNAEVVDAVSQLKKKDAAHHAQLVEVKAAHSRELLRRGWEVDEAASNLRKAVQKARLDKDREYASLAEQERLRAKETVRIAEQGLERKLESRKKELDNAIATASTTAEAAWAKRLRDAEAEHEQELHSLRQKNALQRGGDEKRAARDARAKVEAELAQAHAGSSVQEDRAVSLAEELNQLKQDRASRRASRRSRALGCC